MINGSVYLIMDSDEIHLGSVAEVCECYCEEGSTAGRAILVVIADLVADLAGDPSENSARFTIEIR